MAGLIAGLDFVHERRQFLRFLVAGAANTALSYAIYAAGIALGLGYQLASLVALLAGIATGFVAQGKVAFRSQLQGRFVPFVALWSLLYLANIVIIGALTFFGTNLYLAGLLAAAPVNAASYLAMRSVIFAPQQAPPLRKALLWALGLVFVARLFVITHLSMNWDEFLNLSMVYDYRRGDITEVFQTAFVHLFQWLPLVSPNEVDQLVAARFFTLGCTVVTSLALFHAARRFMAVDSALVAVLAFNCFGAAFLYATDFRTDTLATSAILGATALATHRRAEYLQMVAIGILIAIGGALTIKSVFFLPTIGILVLSNAWCAGNYVRSAKVISTGAISSALCFATIMTLHAWSLDGTSSPTGFIGRTGGATLLSGKYDILSNYWPGALLGNLGFWILVLFGVLGLARDDLPGSQITAFDRIGLASFALPLLVPLIYSEVYPYFHPFMIAPVAVLAGLGFVRLDGAFRWAALVLLFIGTVSPLAQKMDDGLKQQRYTLALVHRLFPQPVAYIDHTSMVSSFRKKGPFMSSWGMSDYRAAGVPMMPLIIRRDQPAFMLETRSLLAVDRIDPKVAQKSKLGLFGADVTSLRDNYLRYWGPLFLPGKILEGSGRVDIAIGGKYRIEGDGALCANGRKYAEGEKVDLVPGPYAYSSEGSLRLVWDFPPAPSTRPPEALFSGW